MDTNPVKALFAVYVVVVPLYCMLDDSEFYCLAAVKRDNYGLVLHFATNELIPTLFTLGSFSCGIVSMAAY